MSAFHPRIRRPGLSPLSWCDRCSWQFRALLAALFAAGVSASSGFANSCWDIHLTGKNADTKLGATCRNIGGGDIPLNSCLANNNGIFACKTGGNAMNSCKSCSLAGTFLTCTCNRINGGTDVTNINLNNCVGNNDGRLQC
ncbi:Cyanovirin-N [Auricularia subglabra TFB-10046 SS5]|nr:Cyanovirin-N [Auricularia subglabra TFB-10046 SS5]